MSREKNKKIKILFEGASQSLEIKGVETNKKIQKASKDQSTKSPKRATEEKAYTLHPARN